jgi:hypothetical protein
MKKYSNTLILLLLISNIFAQAPQKMSYQAVIRNSSNMLISNTSVGMKISILQSTASGTPVYIETQSPTTNTNGLVSIAIGDGIAASGNFSTINWSNGPYFIKTETDPTGGTNYSITGTSQLLSVPYALFAANSAPGPQGPKGDAGLQGPQGLTGLGFSHFIGELYQGGIIVSIWKINGVEHGLIASLTNLHTYLQYSNVFTLIGSSAQNNTNGQGNTTAIVNQAGCNWGAAMMCDTSTMNGYSDWYLPSISELVQCQNAGCIVNEILGPTNGFLNLTYHSSTERTDGGSPNSYALNLGAFILGQKNPGNDGGKSGNFAVRAVRRF